jgi:hypothetical protein
MRSVNTRVLGRVALAVGMVVLAAANASDSPSVAARTDAEARTSFYNGPRLIGFVESFDPGMFTIECPYYGAAVVFVNKARTWMTSHWAPGDMAGHAARMGSNLWAIYVQTNVTPARLTGYAAKRHSSTWSVVRAGRVYGHTRGPDGPAAALAMLTSALDRQRG